MTPRMITIMARVPESVSDQHAAEAFHDFAREAVFVLHGEADSLLTDCQTITAREDEFFRNRPNGWKAKE